MKSFTVIRSTPPRVPRRKRRLRYIQQQIGNRPDRGRRSTAKVSRIRVLVAPRLARRGWALLVRVTVKFHHGRDALTELSDALATAQGLLQSRMRIMSKSLIRRERGMTKGILLRDEGALAALRFCLPRKYIHGVLRIVTERSEAPDEIAPLLDPP